MNTKITVEGVETMENAMKVAFATKDMEEINAHFGGAREFVVYNVSKEGFSLCEVIKTDASRMEEDGKTEERVRALSGINIVYCESIGGTAAAKVIRAGIHPMKVNEPTPIKEVLGNLVRMLNGNPPPWVKRIICMQTEHDVRQERWVGGE